MTEKAKRVVTNEDIIKYTPLINKWLRDSVVKNWNEAKLHADYSKVDDVTLGNTGVSMEDIKQHLMTELVVALQNYDPEYRTAQGKSVKEMTFVFQHLFNRTGQLMKKMTRKSSGYGKWSTPIDTFEDYANKEQ